MADYTILLIDYEPRSIERISSLFEDEGYRVEVARDGISGIEAFESTRPDLTLIEAMLPLKHGFEVCRELKRTPHGQVSPILIITGVYKGRKYRWQARYDYGCDEYIEKPVTDDTLLHLVRTFLKRRSAAGGKAPEAVPADRPAEDGAFRLDGNSLDS